MTLENVPGQGLGRRMQVGDLGAWLPLDASLFVEGVGEKREPPPFLMLSPPAFLFSFVFQSSERGQVHAGSSGDLEYSGRGGTRELVF